MHIYSINTPFLADFRLVSGLEEVEVGRQRAGGENAGVALGIKGGAEEHVVAKGRILDPGSLSCIGDGPIDLQSQVTKANTRRDARRVLTAGGVRRDQHGESEPSWSKRR